MAAKTLVIPEKEQTIGAYWDDRVANPQGGWHIQCTWKVHTQGDKSGEKDLR